MSAHGLQVASFKSEAVVLTKKWTYTNPRLVMGGLEIPVLKKAKYLGVVLDTRRCFRAHIEAAASSTKGLVNVLGRLMPNMGDLGSAKRKLLMSAAMSRLLHSSLV